MGNFRNVIVAVVGVLAVGATAGDTICSSLPARTGVGRSSSTPYDSKADWCPNQIEKCGFICGGKTSSNTCDLLSSSSACYSCTCADGTTPQLELYDYTIPSQICQQYINNCAASPSGSFTGECSRMPKCGGIYLTAPIGAAPEPASDYPLSTLTSALEPVAATTAEPELELSTTTLASTITESEVVATTTVTETSTSESSTTSTAEISSTTSSVIETSTSSIAFATPANSTASQTSTFSSSRVSLTVSTTFLQAGAVKTSFPWANAALGVAGFVLAGQL